MKLAHSPTVAGLAAAACLLACGALAQTAGIDSVEQANRPMMRNGLNFIAISSRTG